MAVIIDIADAIVADLNAQTFGLPFTAARYYLPKFQLEDMDTLHVSVVPKEVEIIPAEGTRGAPQYDYLVDVGIQKRFDADDDNADIDPLADLVEEIADRLTGRNLVAGAETALWITTGNSPIYAPEAMSQDRMFTSVLTLSYRLWR